MRIVERKDTGLTFALKYIRKDEGLSRLIASTRDLNADAVSQSCGQRAFEISLESDGCSSISTTLFSATCVTASRISNICMWKQCD